MAQRYIVDIFSGIVSLQNGAECRMASARPDVISGIPIDGDTRAILKSSAQAHIDDVQSALRDPSLSSLIKEFELAQSKSSVSMALVREMKRAISHVIPDELSQKLIKIDTEGRDIHAGFRDGKIEWKEAADWLEDVFTVRRLSGQIIANQSGIEGVNAPLDALYDIYCPGFTADDIQKIFDNLVPALSKIAKEATNLQTDPPKIEGHFPLDLQEKFVREIGVDLGFDFTRGDLYLTEKAAVEGGTPDNVILAVKNPSEDNFWNLMKSSVHEYWHGLYLQGLPED